jgi:hypothetical protein
VRSVTDPLVFVSRSLILTHPRDAELDRDVLEAGFTPPPAPVFFADSEAMAFQTNQMPADRPRIEAKPVGNLSRAPGGPEVEGSPNAPRVAAERPPPPDIRFWAGGDRIVTVFPITPPGGDLTVTV